MEHAISSMLHAQPEAGELPSPGLTFHKKACRSNASFDPESCGGGKGNLGQVRRQKGENSCDNGLCEAVAHQQGQVYCAGQVGTAEAAKHGRNGAEDDGLLMLLQ